jgi:hypothetical protein
MRFSVKPAVLVLVVGALLAGAFSLHRIHPKTCNYRNWRAPCHTSGVRVDWTDVSAFGIALAAAIAAGLIGGNRNRFTSASIGSMLKGKGRERFVGDELHQHYRNAPGNLAQSIFLATMKKLMQGGTPRLVAEEKVVKDLRKTYPNFTPLRH